MIINLNEAYNSFFKRKNDLTKDDFNQAKQLIKKFKLNTVADYKYKQEGNEKSMPVAIIARSEEKLANEIIKEYKKIDNGHSLGLIPVNGNWDTCTTYYMVLKR